MDVFVNIMWLALACGLGVVWFFMAEASVRTEENFFHLNRILEKERSGRELSSEEKQMLAAFWRPVGMFLGLLEKLGEISPEQWIALIVLSIWGLSFVGTVISVFMHR